MLKVCKNPGPTACLKMVNKVCLQSWRKEKKFHGWTWAALNLQPSDLQKQSELYILIITVASST